MSASFAQLEREAMSLPAEDRARLANKLWDSLPCSGRPEMVMTPELERLLDEGCEDLDRAKTTDELRRQK